jgi:hypothetical protein
MASYCEEADVYAVTRPGSIPSEARLCASALAAGDVFTLDGHGLATGDPISFRAEDGGSLPVPFSTGTTYYAIRLSDSAFQAAASEVLAEAGTETAITADGDLVLLVRERPMSRWIDWASAEVEQMLPAHVVPIDESAIPTAVRAATAKLAAYQARVWSGRSEEDLATLLDETRKQLTRWGKGVPLRGANAPTAANLAVYGSAATAADPRGWGNVDGTIP